MAFFLSPQVAVFEKDMTVSVPAVSTSVTGMVGQFQWGPCFQRTLVTQDSELESMFYQPNELVYEHWWSAWNFLQYSNQLQLVRAVDDATAENAGAEIANTTDDSAPLEIVDYIGNSDDADNYSPSYGTEIKWQIFAKYPGLRGNDIKVAIANYDDYDTESIVTGTLFSAEFDYGPADATEVAICVLDGANDDEILEKWIVSLTVGAKSFDNSNYYCEDLINGSSKYILLYNDVIDTDVPASQIGTALTGGLDGAPAVGDMTTGYDLFENKEEVDVSMIIDGANNDAVTQAYIADNLTDARHDCVGIFTVPKADVVGVASVSTAVTNMLTYVGTTLNKSTSWNSLYGNWKYQYDTYADKYRWIPVSGDLAGITAQTHYTRDPWFAPAFYNRGKIKNCVKLAVNPKLAYRDQLYQANINPIVTSKGDGHIVMGQKTLLTTPSSFNRLDVRWLFLVIEKAIAVSAKFFIGEKNTAFTRRQFKGLVEPYLRDIQGREGIQEFYVQVDENVNTPEVIQRNEFRASIYVKPTMTAEFIILEFVNVRQGVEFSEVIKKA